MASFLHEQLRQIMLCVAFPPKCFVLSQILHSKDFFPSQTSSTCVLNGYVIQEQGVQNFSKKINYFDKT